MAGDAGTYRVGQIWTYETRRHEPESLLCIVRIDQDREHGVIFHVYLDGLSIGNPLAAGGIQDTLPHTAVSETSLRRSLKECVAETAELPDYAQGYESWKTLHGGVFDDPVKDVIEMVENLFGGQRSKH